MNQEQQTDKNIYKILFYIAMGLIAFFGAAYFSGTTSDIIDLQTQAQELTTQMKDDKVIWQSAIVRTDERLKNLEQRFGIQGVKPSSYVEQLKQRLAVPTKSEI
jgi:hypothetical protein